MKLEYGKEEWMPPDKFTAAIDYGCKVGLNLLLVMVFAFNIYAQVALAQSYIVIPDESSPAEYIHTQNVDLPPWEQPYEPEHPIVTQSEYEDLAAEGLRWTWLPNAIGIVGILLYILLSLSQPWYRKRVQYKFGYFD